MDRLINVRVGGGHLWKDSRLAGNQGEANTKKLRIEFDDGWDGYAKKVIFWDAKGQNPVERTLTADMLEDINDSTRIYICPIPGEPMAEAGMMTFVIDGYLDGVRQRTLATEMEVVRAPIANNAGDPADPIPTQAEQLQVQIDTILGDMQEQAVRAETAASGAETAKTSAEQARADAVASAEAAAESKEHAEASAEAANISETNAASSASKAKASETNAASSAASVSTAKSDAEKAAARAETAKTAAESANTVAQTAKTAAESAKSGAESAKTAAQAAQSSAETAKTAAQTAQSKAEAAQRAAEKAAEEAKEAADVDFATTAFVETQIDIHNKAEDAHEDIRQRIETAIQVANSAYDTADAKPEIFLCYLDETSYEEVEEAYQNGNVVMLSYDYERWPLVYAEEYSQYRFSIVSDGKVKTATVDIFDGWSESEEEVGGGGGVPIDHAVNDTTYGKGTIGQYGHVKLSDSLESYDGSTSGIAATPLAVKMAYDKAKAAAAAIPAVTAADNGKFLRVVNGVWAAEALTNVAEEGA